MGHLMTMRINHKCIDSNYENLNSDSSLTKLTARLITKHHNSVATINYTSPNEQYSDDIHYFALNSWEASDVIIITIKAPQLEGLCKKLAELTQLNKISSDTPIILMMNGMGLIELVESYLPNSPVFHAVTTHGVKFEKNVLIHNGRGDTYVGSLHQKSFPHLKSLCAMLDRYLPKVYESQDIQAKLWRKLFINSVINPLTTIYQVNNGAISSDSHLNREALLLCNELTPIVSHTNTYENAEQLFTQVCKIAEQTQNNISSMWQDHLNQRVSEIDSITGYVLKQANRLGVSLPLHSEIYRKIKRLENQF